MVDQAGTGPHVRKEGKKPSSRGKRTGGRSWRVETWN